MLQEALGGRQLKTTKTKDKRKKQGCPTELQYRMVPQGPNPGCPEQVSQQQMNHRNLLMILIIWGIIVCVAIKGKAKTAIYSCCKKAPSPERGGANQPIKDGAPEHPDHGSS